MLYYEGLSCPVCNKNFVDGDDIVACPHCGLPHHRTCWMQENRCHDADHHGTDRQWSREKAKQEATKGHIPPNGQPQNDQICPHCYTKNFEFAEFCTHCGHPLRGAEWHSAAPKVDSYTPFEARPAAPHDVEEEMLSAIVGVNTQYYIPRFRNIKEGRYGGWNWGAFLLGPLWLIYRKQYALGGLLFFFQTVLNVALLWLESPMFTAVTEAELMAVMEQLAANPLMFPAMLLSTLLTVARILLGIKGNDLYLYHCKRRIEKAREHTGDLTAAELSSFGGVSVGITIVFYLASVMITNGLATFLMQ